MRHAAPIVRGTHQGELLGLPPTGKQFTAPLIEIVRIANGKAVERWGVAERALHDDLIVSASLCAVLDRLDWRPRVARGR